MAYGQVNVPFITQAEFNDGIKAVRNDLSKLVGYVPVQAAALTYSGSAKSPTWTDYDTAKLSVGGTTSATNAGNYTATFAPKSGYTWLDGSTAAKSAKWSIDKANGSLSLNKTSVNLSYAAPTATVTATRAGDGVISVTSSNPSVVAASVSGTTITLVGVASGSATITVKVGEGTNHKAPAAKTISVSVQMASANLADNDPATIQAAAKAGQAKNLWSVGDKMPIMLQGTVGELKLDGVWCATILEFDHNSAIEGNNTIHFQLGLDSNGVNIAFVDSGYGGSATTQGKFSMSYTDAGYYGEWNDSYMRQTICAAFLKVLPAEWQKIIASCTKYSRNRNTDNPVTRTSDKIWLLAFSEVFGNAHNGFDTGVKEADYVKQYDYYKNGNSKIRYKHNKLSDACIWLLRSVGKTTPDTYYCSVDADGSFTFTASYNIRGFSPGFMVA